MFCGGPRLLRLLFASRSVRKLRFGDSITCPSSKQHIKETSRFSETGFSSSSFVGYLAQIPRNLLCGKGIPQLGNVSRGGIARAYIHAAVSISRGGPISSRRDRNSGGKTKGARVGPPIFLPAYDLRFQLIASVIRKSCFRHKKSASLWQAPF